MHLLRDAIVKGVFCVAYDHVALALNVSFCHICSPHVDADAGASAVSICHAWIFRYLNSAFATKLRARHWRKAKKEGSDFGHCAVMLRCRKHFFWTQFLSTEWMLIGAYFHFLICELRKPAGKSWPAAETFHCTHSTFDCALVVTVEVLPGSFCPQHYNGCKVRNSIRVLSISRNGKNGRPRLWVFGRWFGC